MVRNNKFFLIAALLIVVVLVAFIISTPNKKDSSVDLPLSNEKAYTKEVNQWLAEKQEAHVIAESTKTPEKEAKEEAFFLRLISKAEAAVRDIEFYGKIVDQYGNPVPGVVVKYKARSEYLAAGTGYGKAVTDSEGRFNTIGSEGTGLSIRTFTKPGYQFPGIQRFDNYQRFDDSVLWKDFTKDKPYVFKAWKVDRYPKVNTGDAIFGFDPGETYSMDFTTPNVKSVKHKEKLDLDLQVRFERDDSGWSAKLLVPDGGLIEADDFYLNLAPESGYQKEINFNGPKEKYVEIKKNYYLYSRGKMYGSLVMRIFPYYRDLSAIDIRYVMNLENERNLTVKQKQPTWD